VTTELSRPATRRKAIEHPGRFAIVAGGLTLVAILFAGAVFTSETEPPPSSLPAEVQAVSPRPGSIVPPQQAITVDLRDDLNADLTLCGPTQGSGCTPLPADQVNFVRGLGQLTFQPGDDTDVQRYEPGRNRVIVSYYSQADPAARPRLLHLDVHLQVLGGHPRRPTSSTAAPCTASDAIASSASFAASSG
jgi:hypothetical protein